MKSGERVDFRLLQMECCGSLICNLTRLPTYCPNCGKMCFPAVKGWVLLHDSDAWLTYDEDKKP